MTGPTSVPARQQQAERIARKYGYLPGQAGGGDKTVLQRAMLLSDDCGEVTA